MAQMQGQDLGGAQGQVRRKTLLEQQAEWNNPAQFAGLLSDRATSLRRRKEREPILAPVIDQELAEMQADPTAYAARQAQNIATTITQLREYIGE